MKKNIIQIVNIEIDDVNFPRLFRFAQTNPEGLEKTLLSISKASGNGTDEYRSKNALYSTAINLESDLQHG